MAGTVTVDTIKSSLSTPTVFQNTSGTEIGQLCKGWVNYTPTTPTIKSSFNFSSITRSSTGVFTLTMTNAMTDINYSCPGSASATGVLYCIVTIFANSSAARVAPTTTTFNSSTWNGTSVYEPADATHVVIR